MPISRGPRNYCRSQSNFIRLLVRNIFCLFSQKFNRHWLTLSPLKWKWIYPNWKTLMKYALRSRTSWMRSFLTRFSMKSQKYTILMSEVTFYVLSVSWNLHLQQCTQTSSWRIVYRYIHIKIEICDYIISGYTFNNFSHLPSLLKKIAWRVFIMNQMPNVKEKWIGSGVEN